MIDKYKALRSTLPESVELLVVSKRQSLTRMLELARALPEDARVFGENYQSEIIEKLKMLENEPKVAGLRMHVIGPLQTNKLKKMFDCDRTHHYLNCVQSISDNRIAEALNRTLAAFERRLECYIQVNVHDNDQQSGCRPSDALSLVEHISTHCPQLKLVGLMCIGDVEAPRQTFEALSALRSKIESSSGGLRLRLSMGMSSDLAVAVECGSDQVRVGTAIMGAR